MFSESLTSCVEAVVTLIKRERLAHVSRRETGNAQRPNRTGSGIYMTHTQEMRCLEKIDEWYRSKCDGIWEHQSGFSLESSDRPGWLATIDMDAVDLASAWGWSENIESRHSVDVRMDDGKIVIWSTSLNSCLEAVVTLIIHEQAEQAYRGEPSPFVKIDEMVAGNESRMTRAQEKEHLALIEEWFREHRSAFRMENTDSPGWLVTIDGSLFDMASVLRLREIMEVGEIVKVQMADGNVLIESESLLSCMESVVVLIDLHERHSTRRARAT